MELGPVPQYEGVSTNGTGVVEITFEQPGDVEINDEAAELTEMPVSFNGTNALTNASMTSSPGKNVDNAVSFNLIPVFAPPLCFLFILYKIPQDTTIV
ncbi:MAG: hypothetical protein WAK50_03760 [Nitrososphaeraceae archaeon]